MDFEDKNLTKEDIRQTLKLMEEAINFYKLHFKNNSYKFTPNHGRLNIKMRSYLLPHLLGIDVNIKNTWLQYIEKSKIGEIEWLEAFVESYEFLEYMIIKKKENCPISFSKIKYKSQHFKQLDLKTNTCFIFNNSVKDYQNNNIGIISDNKIISLKLVREVKYDNSSILLPKSLYIYELDDERIKRLSNFKFPKSLIIATKKGKEVIETPYTDKKIEETKEKILQMQQHN